MSDERERLIEIAAHAMHDHARALGFSATWQEARNEVMGVAAAVLEQQLEHERMMKRWAS